MVDAITEKDVVLVYIEDKPAFFARIEGFEPDNKPKWWQVQLLVLQLPLRVVTWILRREQINGEPFTMGGTPIRIEKVESPPATESPDLHPEEAPADAEASDDSERHPKPKPARKQRARILSIGGDGPEDDTAA